MPKILLFILTTFSLLIITKKGFTQNKIEKPQSIEKRKKELQKVKEKQDNELDEATEANQERHLSIQAKSTRKRMRKSKRKAKKHNSNKKGFSFKRIFGKK